ncbi:MAG: hypothetical protein JWL83_2961 [Actinomycetia bacterium]|nr:hypothetical protein [Actinomycetes bacterium]
MTARDQRLAWLLALAVLVIVGPIVAAPSAQPASRYALTAALAEHHTIDIGRYRHNLGVDHAVYDGRWRSDKPPGQPLFAVPFSTVGRLIGLQPATYLRRGGDLGMWWVTVWSSMIPFAVIVMMLFGAIRRVAARTAFPVAVAFAGSTLLLPYGAQLYGHVLAAACAFGAWLVADSARRGDRGRLLAAGALAGCAFAVEYHAAIVAVVVAIVVAVRHRRGLWWYALGAVPPLAITALYQWAAFGAPWRLPYGYYAGVINGSSDGGYAIPSLASVVRVFTSSNGLLVLTPLAVIAIGASVHVALRPGVARVHALVALAVTVPYIALVAGWSGTALAESPGPRYLIPALPFLAVPLAVVWDRVRRLAILATGWGALVMAGATFTYMNVGIGEPRISGYVQHLRAHDFPATLWSIGFGRTGVVLYVTSVAAVVVALARAAKGTTNACSTDLVPAATLACHEYAGAERSQKRETERETAR